MGAGALVRPASEIAPPANAALAWTRRVAAVWAAAVLGMTLLVAADIFLFPLDMIDATLLREDTPALLLSMLGVMLLLAVARGAVTMPVPAWAAAVPSSAAICCAALVLGVLLYAATRLYVPLSMDEVMARFDAVIFSRGKVVAEVAPEWRAYVPALQWQFRVEAPDHAYWASMYLPVNAAFRALSAHLGDQNLTSPAWAVVSLLALFGLARRLWPERRDAAFLAVVLMATSAQFLVTATTAFAMSAHLALNLVWLCLFLGPGRASQAGSVVVGFLATGLHQLIFHPLFAAPFILTLWLQRRWTQAAVHTLAYAGIGLFWISYWGFALPGAPTGEAGLELGPERWFAMALNLLTSFDITKTAWMIENLLRFALWQSLLLVPLAALGLRAAWRGPVARNLALGVLLTTVALWLLLPNQGFGWGYRYLHGFIGSLCLLAAYGWVAATERMTHEVRARATRVMAVAVVFSVVVLVPLRLQQAWAYTTPFAKARDAITRLNAEVVLIDDTGVFKANILPENDPFLRASPKIMMLSGLTPADLERLCGDRSVALFDKAAAASVGLRTFDAKGKPAVLANRAVLRRLGCARDRVGTAR